MTLNQVKDFLLKRRLLLLELLLGIVALIAIFLSAKVVFEKEHLHQKLTKVNEIYLSLKESANFTHQKSIKLLKENNPNLKEIAQDYSYNSLLHSELINKISTIKSVCLKDNGCLRDHDKILLSFLYPQAYNHENNSKFGVSNCCIKSKYSL